MNVYIYVYTYKIYNFWHIHTEECHKIQVYLGDIADFVPDHCDKVNISIKLHELMGFPVHYTVIY